jgi:predicted N-acyltransferase
LTERTARIIEGIARIGATDWNACANPGGAIPRNPFLRHEFLHALEASGSAVAKTGWRPFHLVLEEAGACIGVVPMYLKGHSQGEYVFDHAWADAWHRAGGRYYPKLQIAVPFTPATGRRLLARDGDPATAAELLAACIGVAEQAGVSSLHATFLTEAEWSLTPALGCLQRMDQQFHWHNRGYATFDEFLGDLAAKKRKNLKRERRDALGSGIEIEWVTGTDLREHHWDAFYRFYMDTGSRKWGTPYLTREFFSLVSAAMPEDILLILCRRDGRYVAGALNFIGSDTLYGRNWGCIEDHPFLHFEACYYQAIDFAIANGLRRVEAGAQGGHKVARGYLPTPTYSAHWIADPRFRAAIEDYLERERAYVADDIAYIERHGPFRSTLDLGELRASREPRAESP